MKTGKASVHISRKPNRIAPTLLLIFACTTATICQAQRAPKKVIIDTDPGTDDALAMLTKVSAGELTLGLAADGRETQIAAQTEQIEGPVRVFNRNSLKGF